MLSFVHNPNVRTKRPASHLAMAIALSTGVAIGAAALEEPVHAQKKKKKGKEAKTNYSQGFLAAYRPADALTKGLVPDEAAIRAALPGVVAAIETDDDRNAAGGLVYNAGNDFDDPQLQLQGLDLMIASGKPDSAKLGQFHFTAFQLHRNLEDYPAARTSLQKAIDSDYSFQGRLADGTVRTFNASDMRMMLAESYFDAEDYSGGLSYLKDIINAREAAGQPIDESWIRRGFATAYNNDLAQQAAEFAEMYLLNYPSPDRWGDAIAVQRNFASYDDPELLDLLRLADRTESLRSDRDYNDYINAADARRLPSEVGRVIDEGIAGGFISSGDPFIAEAKSMAAAQTSGLRRDLPALERDAQGGNANLASNAGDVYLNFNEPAKAEKMYQLALTKPGVDSGRVLTRLGIAQIDQGKMAEAKATFEKVRGARRPIARLWGHYVDSLAPAAEAAPAAPPEEPAAE